MATENKKQPQRGAVYSLREILEELELRDSPSLGFTYKQMRGVIQNSHCTYEELLAVPSMAETQWIFRRETHEWIPVFDYAGDENSIQLVLEPLEVSRDYFTGHAENSWWAIPKGLPRPQQFAEDVVLEEACDQCREDKNNCHCDGAYSVSSANFVNGPDDQFANDEQKRQVEFVRQYSPQASISEAVEAYRIYRSYRDEGQTDIISRQYAGLL